MCRRPSRVRNTCQGNEDSQTFNVRHMHSRSLMPVAFACRNPRLAFARRPSWTRAASRELTQRGDGKLRARDQRRLVVIWQAQTVRGAEEPVNLCDQTRVMQFDGGISCQRSPIPATSETPNRESGQQQARPPKPCTPNTLIHLPPGRC